MIAHPLKVRVAAAEKKRSNPVVEIRKIEIDDRRSNLEICLRETPETRQDLRLSTGY